ncbi:MAG: ATP-binding cassette domain-containing protein, partial [Caldisericia bacterium]|nr:ATP-binding cassette domain-containing protein [Caldisericia bacterium]
MGVILSVRNIVKVYPNGVVANKGVSLDIEEGTIHAIVGENGAGKTTLMKIIFGIEEPQEGKIFFKGKEIKIKNPFDAIKIGIGMVHQHFMLAPDLTVYENLLLGIEPKRGVFLDTKKAIETTKKFSEEFGLPVPFDKKIKDLPIGLRQRVEILKALIRNAELLILDEPTSVLTPQETEVLFNTLRALKKSGKTIIFISHKLKEVLEIADKITVMRDGKIVATKDAKELTEHEIAYLMVGRDISFERIPPSEKEGEVILEAKDIVYINEENIKVLKGISFQLKSYEILGLAGIEGNGQTELVEILTGLRKPTSGKIFLKGEDITNLIPRKIREKKVSHIPEDRMKDGVADKATIEENIIVDRYYKVDFS